MWIWFKRIQMIITDLSMYFSMDSRKTIEIQSIVRKAISVFTSAGIRDGDERSNQEANQAISTAEEKKWIWYKRIQMIITCIPVQIYEGRLKQSLQ